MVGGRRGAGRADPGRRRAGQCRPAPPPRGRVWLSDRSPAATGFAAAFLTGHSGTGNDVTGAPKPFTSSGLATVYAGTAASDLVGDAPADRDVPILVAAPGLSGRTVGAPVETTQVAPTILTLLGLDPGDLAAVRAEHTRTLPGLD